MWSDLLITHLLPWVNQHIENPGNPGVVGFDLGPLIQGQTRIAKDKSAYNSLIIGRRGLGW